MALIRKVPLAPSIDFMGRRKPFLILSGCLLLASLLIFVVQGLNLGVDFRGGILHQRRSGSKPPRGRGASAAPARRGPGFCLPRPGFCPIPKVLDNDP